MFKCPICLTERCYRTVSNLTMCFILLPGLVSAVLSVHCIMLRTYLELSEFTIDVDFFIYRIIISVALIWWAFEAIFRLLYGYEKISRAVIIEAICMIACAAITIVSAMRAEAGWSDILSSGFLPTMIVIPLIMLFLQVFTVAAIGLVLLAMFACDLIGWFQYAHSEALAGHDSQPFIIFCRENSK